MLPVTAKGTVVYPGTQNSEVPVWDGAGGDDSNTSVAGMLQDFQICCWYMKIR